MNRHSTFPDGPDHPPPALPDQASRSLLRNFPFAMVLADPHQPDMPIIYVNRHFTEVTGYSFDACVGRNCRFLQGEHTDPDAVAKIREALKNHDELTVDLLNYRADGTPFQNRLMIAPLDDDNGDLLYILGVQTVVEPQNSPFARAAHLTEQLRELQHRVKNHLAMILGLIRAETRARPPEEVIEALTQRIEAVNLLYDSLSNTGNGASETIDLGAYLSRVASALHMIDNRPGVIFNVQVESLDVDADFAGRIGLYLSEVVTNALKHGLAARGEGKIDVGLTRDGDHVVLTVSDNGPGLGDATWPEGDSIGSVIVRDFLQRAHADLTIDEGDVTSVSVRLPLVG